MNEMSDASGVELKLLRRAANSNIPINGSFELLPLCNMDCEMCYVRLSRREMEEKGRMRTASEWLALAKQAKEAGTLFLLLTGGEPLLYPDFKELYLSLQNMGFILTVNTNGTLMDEEWAEFFSLHKPRRINLTLYGSDNETYHTLCRLENGFDRAVNGVKLLRERNVEVKLGCSAVNTNLKDIDRIFGLADSLGTAVHIDSYMYPAKRERELSKAPDVRLAPSAAALVWFKGVLHAYRGDSYTMYRNALLLNVERLRSEGNNIPDEGSPMECMAGNCSFTINWQGYMRPCVMLSSPGIPVFETGFMPGWEKLRDELSAIRLNPKCSICEYRPFCHICAASALYESGGFDGVSDYLCELAKASYELILNHGEN